jgi:hypothetical protein
MCCGGCCSAVACKACRALEAAVVPHRFVQQQQQQHLALPYSMIMRPSITCALHWRSTWCPDHRPPLPPAATCSPAWASPTGLGCRPRTPRRGPALRTLTSRCLSPAAGRTSTGGSTLTPTSRSQTTGEGCWAARMVLTAHQCTSVAALLCRCLRSGACPQPCLTTSSAKPAVTHSLQSHTFIHTCMHLQSCPGACTKTQTVEQGRRVALHGVSTYRPSHALICPAAALQVHQ